MFALALGGFVRAGTGWLQWAGLAACPAFLVLMSVVGYLRPVEFRSPQRAAILVPYLVLFFGAILLMDLSKFGSAEANPADSGKDGPDGRLDIGHPADVLLAAR